MPHSLADVAAGGAAVLGAAGAKAHLGALLGESWGFGLKCVELLGIFLMSGHEWSTTLNP